MKQQLSWKPIRRGAIYCASACGGGCTYAAYTQANSQSAALAKALGKGWTTRVHENLGWHWSVVNRQDHLDVSPTRDGYMAIFGARFVGHASKPKAAIEKAILQAAPELEVMKALVAAIEKVVIKNRRVL